MNFVPYNMVINLNMFGPFMKDQVGCYVNSRLVITINGNGFGEMHV